MTSLRIFFVGGRMTYRALFYWLTPQIYVPSLLVAPIFQIVAIGTQLTEAAAGAVGAPGAVPGSDEEARQRLGDYFAEVLLLDQGTTAAKARTELDWSPSHPGLIEEFRHGSYRS